MTYRRIECGPEIEHVTPGQIAAAEVLGYMCCANNTPIEVLLRQRGPAELQTAFWNGWNARFEEEMEG